jgi:hypothetical protein
MSYTVSLACGCTDYVARQPHTRALADFIVHTVVCAHRGDVLIGEFWRENELRLESQSESLYPDCAFQLLAPGDRTFTFYVELDNGTQSVQSPKDRESWERKIRFYERLRDSSGTRFRVLVVSTHSQQRLAHILKTAAALARNPDRSLVYAAGLGEYLAQGEPLTTPCFLDHLGRHVSLVPPIRPARRPREETAVVMPSPRECVRQPSPLVPSVC